MTKISFSGSYGSGKTSLIEEVKKIMSLKYKIFSLGDINLNNPFDEDLRNSFISYFHSFTTQINTENIESQKNHDIMFCDKSILDHWVLWNAANRDVEPGDKLKAKHRLLEQLYRFWISSYNVIFLIRTDREKIDERIEDNEYKVRNEDYIKMIDNLFVDTCKVDGLETVEIWNNGSIDESAQRIIEEISERDLI